MEIVIHLSTDHSDEIFDKIADFVHEEFEEFSPTVSTRFPGTDWVYSEEDDNGRV